jgi:cytochrome b6-f complex iron-sulfur subunit
MGDQPNPPSPTAAAPAAAPPPPPPTKPAVAGNRRSFLLSWAATGWTALSLSLTAKLLWTVRFLFPNVSSEPPMTFKAGDVKDYEDNKVVERFKQDFGVWIVKLVTPKGSEIVALSTICTHLGCTPNWLESEGKFKCPCHGSGFMRDGTNFEGPAPRPLERYKISSEAGQIVVDKSKKFQKELGQWDDPEASVKL